MNELQKLDAADLSGLLGEATGALSRLDAEALERLELRAREMQALALFQQSGPAVSAELMAKFRVFGSVVRATEMHVQSLRQMRAVEIPRRQGPNDARAGARSWGR